MDEDTSMCTSSLRSVRQREREGRRLQLDSAQLWAILIEQETRKLLGAAAHTHRAMCPVEGVQSPPDGKVGNNHQLTEDVMRHAEAMGYDTCVFPHWRWRETDRLHRWLQGARTDELMRYEPAVSCEEALPYVGTLRSVRDTFFHSWVVACKIDAAWIPTLIPLDASCPGTAALRAALEKVYAHLLPVQVVTASTALGEPNASISATDCDADVFRHFLVQYIGFLFPGAGESLAEGGASAVLDALGSSPPRQRLRSQGALRSVPSSTSIRSHGPSHSSAGGDDGTDTIIRPSSHHPNAHQQQQPWAPQQSQLSVGSRPMFSFALVAAVLVVLAEPYCFNEKDASNFFLQAVDGVLIGTVGQTLHAAVDRLDSRVGGGSAYGVGPCRSSPLARPQGTPSVSLAPMAQSTNSNSLPAICGLSEPAASSLASSGSVMRDGSKGGAVRVRIRPTSFVGPVGVVAPYAGAVHHQHRGAATNGQVGSHSGGMPSLHHPSASVARASNHSTTNLPGMTTFLPDIFPPTMTGGVGSPMSRQSMQNNSHGASGNNTGGVSSPLRPLLSSSFANLGSPFAMGVSSSNNNNNQQQQHTTASTRGLGTGRKASVTFVPTGGNAVPVGEESSYPTPHPTSASFREGGDSLRYVHETPSHSKHGAVSESEEYSGWFSKTYAGCSDSPTASKDRRV